MDLGNELKELNTPVLYSVNFSIRRDLLFKLGGFNPDLLGDKQLGDNETGLLRKVLKSGYKVMYTPYAVCYHWVPKKRMTLSYMKRRAANEGVCASYAAYKEKQFSKFALLARSFALMLYVFSHDMLSKIKRFIASNDWYYHEWRKIYGISRLKYELKLIYDKQLKEFVLKEDWIK